MSFPESTPGITRWCALLLAVALSLATVYMAAKLARDQRSGVTIFSSLQQGRDVRIVRAESPEKFRQVMTTQVWAAGVMGGIALISFAFYRRLDASGRTG